MKGIQSIFQFRNLFIVNGVVLRNFVLFPRIQFISDFIELLAKKFMLLQNFIVPLFPYILLPSLPFIFLLLLVVFRWHFLVRLDDVDHFLSNLVELVDEFCVSASELVPLFLRAHSLELLLDDVNFLNNDFEFLHEKFEPSVNFVKLLLPNCCSLVLAIFHFIFVFPLITLPFNYWLLVLLWVHLHIPHVLGRLLLRYRLLLVYWLIYPSVLVVRLLRCVRNRLVTHFRLINLVGIWTLI